MKLSVIIKCFPPSWFQLKSKDKIIYIDPAYLRTYYAKYPKKIEFSKWPDPIDGLPEKLENADGIRVTRDPKDHANREPSCRHYKKRLSPGIREFSG
jgi:hypothetical protein